MFRITSRLSALGLVIGMTIPSAADAQQSSQDLYFNCQRQATEMSGYHGPTPSRERRGGGALRGALKGAAAGAAIGAIGDKNVGKAAKRGAALGLLFGAIAEGSRKSKDKQRRREEERRRVAYQMQLDNCMRYSGR